MAVLQVPKTFTTPQSFASKNPGQPLSAWAVITTVIAFDAVVGLLTVAEATKPRAPSAKSMLCMPGVAKLSARATVAAGGGGAVVVVVVVAGGAAVVVVVVAGGAAVVVVVVTGGAAVVVVVVAGGAAVVVVVVAGGAAVVVVVVAGGAAVVVAAGGAAVVVVVGAAVVVVVFGTVVVVDPGAAVVEVVHAALSSSDSQSSPTSSFWSPWSSSASRRGARVVADVERWVAVLAGGGRVGRGAGAAVATVAAVVRTGMGGGAGTGGTVIVRTPGAAVALPDAAAPDAPFLALAPLLRAVVTGREAACFRAAAASVLALVREEAAWEP